MCFSLLWVLQPELLAVLFVITGIVIADLSNPCTVAFSTASF